MKISKSHPCPVVVEGVTHRYNGTNAETTVLRDVSLSGKAGELTLFLGRSGSGKTTLLSLAAGLIEPSEGRVRLFDRDLADYGHAELQKLRASSMGFVFQTFRLIDSLTALQNVTMILAFAGESRRRSRHRAFELLSHLGVGHLANKKPNHFSQGEKQRVAIARAVANSPSLILADEPTACLESEQGLEIIQLLRHYASERNGCVLVASHDIRLTRFADRVYYLRDGRLAEPSQSEASIDDAGASESLACETRELMISAYGRSES